MFEIAAADAKKLKSATNDDLLVLYSHYKQAIVSSLSLGSIGALSLKEQY
jgi:acyl-CoA-binding protein